MSKPSYRPNCQYRRCWNGVTETVSAATQYVVAPDRTWYVCAACAKKLAEVHHLHEAAALHPSATPPPEFDRRAA